MQRSKIKQSGFNIIEAVIAIAIIGALAGGSWLVYQHIKQSATRTAAASNPNQSSQTITPQAPTITYLNIQEWGIKLPLSTTIKDAYYVPSSQNHAADGTPLAMFIGLKSLDAAGCNAHTANTPGGISTILGTIIRIAPTDVDHVSGVEYVKEWPSATIGQYAYALHDVTSFRTCASSNTLKSIGTALSNATKSATVSTTN
jgi:hypothetical protein